MSDTTMGNRIYMRRKELGMTMEQLGSKVGVNKSSVNKWEKGAVENIRQNRIQEIADALRVTPAWLMGYDNDPMESAVVLADIAKDDLLLHYVMKLSKLEADKRDYVFKTIDMISK